MLRRNRTVSDELKVEKITLYKFYKEQYKNDLFYVNRKYQRKLVWTLDEKQYLIDSILKKYPIPMFLIASYSDENNDVKWEIIDGLQRINAIASFIDGDYAINYEGNYGYFNLDAFTGYGKKISEGKINQNFPVLPLEVCEKFLDYELSFSVTGKDDSEVEEIFRRINSTGRKLSKQDLRQAGVTGCFSNLVRKTATYIRGDYTDNDIIKLSEISTYSITNKELPYGIDVNDIFWIKKKIISEEGIRRSKDEEIIAHIYIYLLTSGKRSSSFSSLERAYDIQNELKSDLDKAVDSEEKIIYWMELFSKTICLINDALGTKDFSEKLFRREAVYNKDYAFLVLFCAISKLLLKGLSVSDKEEFRCRLDDLGNKDLSDVSQSAKTNWNKEIRNHLIDRVMSVLEPCFSYSLEKLQPYPQWDVKMVNFLEHASTEEQMYDFKVGITNFREDTFNKDCISKIVKTLTAMVNTKPNEEGYVLLGIPNDDDDDAEFISKKLKTNVEYCRHYKILGIQDEANIYYQGVDNYLRRIKETIENEPISDSFKNEILTKCHPIEHKGKLLYLFVCKSLEPVYYGKELYVRYGSHEHRVEFGTDEFNTVMRRFFQKDYSGRPGDRNTGRITMP